MYASPRPRCKSRDYKVARQAGDVEFYVSFQEMSRNRLDKKLPQVAQTFFLKMFFAPYVLDKNGQPAWVLTIRFGLDCMGGRGRMRQAHALGSDALSSLRLHSSHFNKSLRSR